LTTLAALAAHADVRAFLGRLTHLDRDAVVRLRPVADGRTALWARLPWGALVTREVGTAVAGDRTVGAAALLAADLAGGAVPARRDQEWRWPLPPAGGTVVERVPAPRLREVATAAAGTLREVTESGLAGRPVGVRLLREALLDHIAIVVENEAGAGRVEVPQRLVQAVVRMGFLGRPADADLGDVSVRVLRSARWVGLAARYGTGWLPPPVGQLAVRPIRRS
jgi:hypothetical protein